MAMITESPLLASLLESDFPEVLFIVEFRDGRRGVENAPRKHLCLRAENVPGYDVVHGLLCTKTQEEAEQNCMLYNFPGDAVQVSFEEARRIAKEKAEPIAGLYLADSEGLCIAFHFVR